MIDLAKLMAVRRLMEQHPERVTFGVLERNEDGSWKGCIALHTLIVEHGEEKAIEIVQTCREQAQLHGEDFHDLVFAPACKALGITNRQDKWQLFLEWPYAAGSMTEWNRIKKDNELPAFALKIIDTFMRKQKDMAVAVGHVQLLEEVVHA